MAPSGRWTTPSIRYLSERRKAEERLLLLMKDQPEIFGRGVPEEKRYPLINLLQGYALSGLDVPEDAIPMSLMGTAWGLVANSFLLGSSQDAQAIRPLLKIAEYEDKPFLDKLRAAFPPNDPMPDFSVANRRVLGDALDRILVANAEKGGIGTEASAIAKEYVAWRAQRNWPQRESVGVYPFSAPQTPYHIPGSVTGRVGAAETAPISLPIASLTPDDTAQIVQWARRFQQALR